MNRRNRRKEGIKGEERGRKGGMERERNETGWR